jgi:lipoprotein-anchoring transpeptidase ErfK/SrfK
LKKEVVTTKINSNVINQRWIETDNGYIYSDSVQPVKNEPNQPVDAFPVYDDGTSGAWVEVTVPYVDFYVSNNPPLSPWLKLVLRPRLYYSQIMWADQIKQSSSGQVLYRITEKYGTYGDIFWAPGEAFRLLTEDDIKPVRPEAQEKIVVVDLTYQTLSCMEGNDEVYFCRVSTGGKYDAEGNPVDKWSTDVGSHPISRKMISTHMSGGTTGAGYDTPGIGWTSLFSNGQAIHSTFWHNGFGVARSHGCVNTSPEDAQWIFRWTVPDVTYESGDISISGMNSSTRVNVIGG